MADLEAIAMLRREAANELSRDVLIEDALARALMGWEPAEMIALAEDLLRQGLPTFERNEPGADWPRRALDGQVTGLDDSEYPGPGSNTLSNGVEYLLDARAHIHEPDRCRHFAVKAIIRAVGAEKWAAWGAEHPEAWRRSYEQRGSPPSQDLDDPKLRASQHPSFLRVQRKMWTEIADRIAARG